MAYIDDIKFGFKIYCTQLLFLQAAQEEINSIGAIPPFPTVVVDDSDYTDVLVDRDQWQADITLARQVYVNQYNYLFICIYNLIIGNGLVSNNWTALEADTPGDFAPFGDNVWLGYLPSTTDLEQLYNNNMLELSSLLPKLVVTEIEPIGTFPEWIIANQPQQPPFNPPSPPFTPPNIPSSGGNVEDTEIAIPVDLTDTTPFWSGNVTDVKVGGVSLNTAAWRIGNISEFSYFLYLYPAQDGLLRVSGTKSVTIVALLFTDNSVSVPLLPGQPAAMAMFTQPTAPASNGAVLAQQPVVKIVDQYGNLTQSATGSVIASVGAATWTIGGTTTKSLVLGLAEFANLTAGAVGAVTGARVAFNYNDFPEILSNPFNIPAP